MSVICRDVFKLIEELAPLNLAEKWDNPGLQVGDPGIVISKVVLALDVTAEVVRETKEKDAGLIVSHHPLIFNPIKSLDFSQPSGRLLESIIKNRITVYSAHTNLDIAEGGVNTVLAALLGLEDRTVLQVTGRESYIKLVVFVPDGHAAAVHQAISGAGAGWIGNYSHCAFQVSGTGMYLPCPGTRPFIGEEGKLAKTGETRLETIVPRSGLAAVLQSMQTAHPYEEIAYDLYNLENSGPAYGLGLVGNIPGILDFEGLINLVKKTLNLPQVRAGGEMSRTVKRVALCGGAGAKLWTEAAALGAEVFLTGDIGYHDAKDMLDAGLCFIDAGHYGAEIPVLPALRDYLEDQCRSRGLEVEFILSDYNGDPFLMI